MIKINDIYIENGHFAKPGKAEEEYRLEDKEIYPGFCDSHTHFIQFGLKKKRLTLDKIKSKKEMYERLDSWIEKKDIDSIIIAEDWDESQWIEKKYPTKDELNKITEGKPVILRRVCGHIAIANDAALRMIPEGLRIIDYKSGILEEDVVLKMNTIFPPSDEELQDAIINAQSDLLKHGITSIHDIMIPRYFRACRKLEDEGLLKISIHGFIKEDYKEELKELNPGEKVKLAGIKVFMDGSIGARTAALDKYKYIDGSKGLLLKDKKHLRELIKLSNKNSYQLAVHAIGDRAIQVVLDAMIDNPKENPLRHRIEHFELARDDQIEEAVEKNIILSMQPNFLRWSEPDNLYEDALGDYYRENNRFGKIKEEGGILTFGSDGMPYGPLFGINAVNNAPFENQRIDRTLAIKAYTEGGSFASGRENEVGKIKLGMKANLVVLDDRGIYMTIVDGEILYRRDD